MSFERHSVGTVDLGGGMGLVTLAIEVEGGKAWISARSNDCGTSFERVYYCDGRWGRMESDPRVEWPRHSPMTVEEAAKDLLFYLGIRLITNDMVRAFARDLEDAAPNMDAAIVMHS